MHQTLGIVGQGFVGTAVKRGMEGAYTIETYDKYLQDRSTVPDLPTLAAKAKLIFVCLPTPMKRDGSCDTSIVESVVRTLSEHATDHVLAIKSTIPPGTTDALNARYGTSKLQIVFQPEFLTERFADEDFRNQNRIIVGGPRPGTTLVAQTFRKVFPEIPIVKTSAAIAEMVKYTTNNFLALKVAFANEMYQICQTIPECDWDKVVEYAKLDRRLGDSHWSVPGPDGHYGYGGSCFIKDTNAMLSFARSRGVDPKVHEGSWQKNLEVRPERDWEELKGRAVTDD